MGSQWIVDFVDRDWTEEGIRPMRVVFRCGITAGIHGSLEAFDAALDGGIVARLKRFG